MQRILSIDFDYFIDTTIEVRDNCFPDGHDNFSPAMTKFIWDRRYEFHDIKDIGVIPDYTKICEFLRNLKGGRVLIADSHREIAQLFDKIRPEEDLELIHVDFHHDMYITGGDGLDCGNWLRFLTTLRPDTDVTWVRREDSETDSLSGEFPYNHTTDINAVQGEFDLIFICFSSPWTPPHLLDKFVEMCLNTDHLEKL